MTIAPREGRWDPALYQRFGEERLRPARDLAQQLAIAMGDRLVRRILDLGCGTGAAFPILRALWPKAELAGLDRSEAMLATAKEKFPDVPLISADLMTFTPSEPVDILYSNATLQWVGNHAALLPRLLTWLAPGGVLAVQMPRNFDQSSHQTITQIIGESRWRERLLPLHRGIPVAEPAWYYRLLAPLCRHLEIWETEYLHILEGADPVAHWVRGTALRPYLSALSPEEGEAFFVEIAAALRGAYPEEADGRTLFPFRRLFFLSWRRSAEKAF